MYRRKREVAEQADDLLVRLRYACLLSRDIRCIERSFISRPGHILRVSVETMIYIPIESTKSLALSEAAAQPIAEGLNPEKRSIHKDLSA